MRWLTVALSAFALAVDARAYAAPPDVAALSAWLRDPDLGVAFQAAKDLLALGPAAAPALPAIVAALDRALPPGIADMHWHEWQGVLPQFHRTLIAAIDAIGPKEETPIPALLRHLWREDVETRSRIVRMLIRLWPQAKEAREAVLALAADGLRLLDDDARARIRVFLESEGAVAISALDGLLSHGNAEDTRYAAERLDGMGDPGFPVLLKHFRGDPANANQMILDVWTRRGTLPDEAVPAGVERVASGSYSGDRAALARAIERSKVDRAAICASFAKALDREPFHFPGWQTVCNVLPGLSTEVGRRWFSAHRPPVSAAPFDARGLRRTAVLGGKGGDAFETVVGEGVLVGLRYTEGDVNWHHVVRSVEPLFETPGGLESGRRVGGTGPKKGEIRAIDGYAVGGLYVQSTDRLLGFAVLFMRRKGDALDPTDAYVHSWHGGAIIGYPEPILAGEGRRIVGIAGRAGADVDAIGLVESGPAPAVPAK